MPSDTTKFLSLDEVLEIHQRSLERFGGSEGVRDMGLLESALFRPRTGYYPDLVSMAAALFESLLLNHPFVDGNKRVAFFATDVFLRINGVFLQVATDPAHTFILEILEDHSDSLEKIQAWIRGYLEESSS